MSRIHYQVMHHDHPEFVYECEKCHRINDCSRTVINFKGATSRWRVICLDCYLTTSIISLVAPAPFSPKELIAWIRNSDESQTPGLSELFDEFELAIDSFLISELDI